MSVVALKKEEPAMNPIIDPPDDITKNHLDKCYGGVESKIVRITPEMAGIWLGRNTNNRALVNNHVEYLMDQMAKGLWEMNGTPIRFSKDGRLIDGQHRLEAVRRSGVPIDSQVLWGLDDDVFKTIDSGKSRTHKDHMFVAGIESSDLGTLAAAVRFVRGFNQDGIYHHFQDRINPHDMIEFVKANPGIDHAISSLPTGTKRVASRALCGAMKYMFSKVDETAAELFFERLVSGVGLTEGSPILALRNRLQGMIADGIPLGAQSVRKQMVYYFVAAWGAYKEGRSMVNLTYRPEWVIKIEGIS